jgi:D-alanyl-D-alanine carboxypeptidase
MSAIIALENIGQNQKITLTPDMLKPFGQSPAIYLGANISLRNLVQASLIQSVNDAAEALTHFIERRKFIQLMNQKAEKLGMTNTIFFDASGLSVNNRSTASDLAKLLKYIHKNHPEILEITRDNNFWLPDRNGVLRKFRNLNHFFPLRAFIGGKAGFLPEARQTFASIFNIDGEPVAIALLHSPNRQADVFSILRQIRE